MRSRLAATRPALVMLAVLAAVVLVVLPGGLAAARAAARSAASARIAVVLLDTNNSPGAVARLAAERREAVAYARALPPDVRVGLIAFGDGAHIVLRPTAARSGLAAALAAVRIGGATSAGIRPALAAAVTMVRALGSRSASRVLVLSDAESIGTGAIAAPPVPVDAVLSNYDGDDFPATVRGLVTATGGTLARAANVAMLARAFRPLPGPRPSRADQGAPAPAHWRLTTQAMVTLLIVFVVLLLLGLLGIGSLRRGQTPDIGARIQRYGPISASTALAPIPQPDSDGRLARAAVGVSRRLLSVGNAEPRLAQRLDRAGIARHPAEWTLLGASASIAIAAVITALAGDPVAGLVIGVLAGWAGMRLLLSFKIARRRAAFDQQLPNVLQLVAGSIQTGFSLAQALDAVVRDDSQPASGEFARALAEARLGVDLEDALESVANRLQSTDLHWVVMAVRIQHETGGNLAEVLRNTVATMRERAYLRRQVRSLSAEGRLSAYVLLALPVLVGGWLFLSDPAYMRPLYSTVLGLTMLGGAVVLVTIGALWMRGLIKVEA